MKQTLCAMALLVLACSSANASLDSRFGGTAYYDTDTDLTWVADANLAATSGYCSTAGNCFDTSPFPSGFFPEGLMTWTQAQAWIASLNAQDGGLGYLGVNDWRLPTVTDTGTPGCNYATTGTDCGYNVDLATGEMARMFYGTLGNVGSLTTGGELTGCNDACLTNTGPFSNMQAYVYWSGTTYIAPENKDAWTFGFSAGLQHNQDKSAYEFAWAVTPGDVVPIPPAVWLFGSALGLMGVMRRKVSS